MTQKKDIQKPTNADATKDDIDKETGDVHDDPKNDSVPRVSKLADQICQLEPTNASQNLQNDNESNKKIINNEIIDGDASSSTNWKITSRANQLSLKWELTPCMPHMTMQVAKKEAEGIPRVSNHVTYLFLEEKFAPKTAEMIVSFQVSSPMFYEALNLHKNLHGSMQEKELLHKVTLPFCQNNVNFLVLPESSSGNCYKNDSFYLLTGNQCDENMGKMEVDAMGMFRWVTKCGNRSSKEIALGCPLQCFKGNIEHKKNNIDGLFTPPHLVGASALRNATSSVLSSLVQILNGMQICSDKRWGHK